MNWEKDLTKEEMAGLRPWMWALNKSDPNRPPVWALIVPYLFTPLVVYLFLRFANYLQPSSILEMLRDWGIYSLVLTVSSLVVLPFVPILKLYIYGSDKNNMMPRISLRREQIVKGTFFVFIHVLSAGITAVAFLGFSGRGWAVDDWWFNTWVMALALLPALIPAPFTLIAKIKLVTLLRTKKRVTT